MKKNKTLLTIVVFLSFFVFCNLAYYLAIKIQTFYANRASSQNEKVAWEKYSNSKIGFKIEYPPLWTVKDDGDMVLINPPSVSTTDTYFSIGQRNDFKSLEEVKRTLAVNVPTTPVQINNASGFKYSDSDYHEVIWLSYSNKIYIIRTYPMNEKIDQILSTFKFDN